MLIQDSTALKNICNIVKDSKFLVIDTEFIRTNTYYPILSLMQIATEEAVFAIDMLSEIDLQPIADILKDPSICKILHSPRQDFEVIFYKFGFIIENIFDTQLAAQFLGLGEQISYELLVKHYLAKQIDKKWQNSNWLQRPLIEEQLKYALLDVSLLMEIYPKIIADLNKIKRLEWACEENQYRYGSIKNFESCAEDQLKKFTSHFRETKQLSKVLILIRLREEKAKSLNLCRNRILSDEDIVSIVKTSFINEKFCKKLGVTSEINKTFLSNLELADEDIVNRVISEKEIQFHNKTTVYELLKVLLKVIAEQAKMPPTLISTTQDLLKISTGEFTKKFTEGWRKEIFTDIIKDFLSNKKGVFCNSKHIEIR